MAEAGPAEARPVNDQWLCRALRRAECGLVTGSSGTEWLGNMDKFEPYRSLPEWPCGAGMAAKCWHYRLSFRDLESPLRSVSFLDPRVEALDLDATPTRI